MLNEREQIMKKNNKGFTLVELIVVIAILGVLMAVLVPQYIQYVEKSREGTDRSTISEMYHAIEVSAASSSSVTKGTVTIAVAADGGITYGGTAMIGTTNLSAEAEKVCPAAKSAMKSKLGKTLTTITINVHSDGSVGWNSAVPTINGEKVGGSVLAAEA
ncbi:MAG: prepilin-type N-terminal cleavage/methylation domain-containing protein [Clostridia bacterium]|nr:prepilin-type N-terminal cleavage/methylation domain-containing protein [Clostridia bacterium]